ncbi:hypothetical protein F5Y09DRAFT_324127 [Xylaria sp. FL1042]|nr:hypothetical protein F5Y09DRAFT_324127 [Xylaria sp. FL1042]
MSAQESIRARRQRLALVPRACEACKVRKIRCDRSNPCSNCQTSGIVCEQATARSDTRPAPTDRITQLEGRIRQLEDRLSQVEDQNKDSTVVTVPSRPISAEAAVAIEPRPQTFSFSPNKLYQGSCTFTTLSAEASEAAQVSALSNSSDSVGRSGESSNDLHDSIEARNMIFSSDGHYFSPVSSRHPIPSLESLPVSLVISIILKIKARSAIFLHGYLISDASLIENICRRVCFPIDGLSTGLVASMHGILYFLLREYLILGESLGKEYDMESLAAQCERSFNAGIETYDILAVPSFENILSLAIGVIKAQNEAKLFLARTLASAATNHCHALGYHREVSYQSDYTELCQAKRRLFWCLYVLDKNMSLLLGRGSNFQDIEIDVQYPSLSTDEGRKPWDEWFHLAIELAKRQGQIYDRLYSIAGLQAELTERMHHIERLEAALHNWHTRLEQLDSTNANYQQVFCLSRTHWDIMYYSTLTCLLRASATPSAGGEISSRCFQAARLSLESHLRCFAGYKDSNMLSDADFANWVLHNSSFTPFIVLFLHSIAVSSSEDLNLLDEVVETLRATRLAGKLFERLYEICATFARLARRLVDAAQPCVGAYNQSTDSLQLPETADQMPLHWSESLQGFEEATNEFSDACNVNISSVFTEWINGQPSIGNMSDVDFGPC